MKAKTAIAVLLAAALGLGTLAGCGDTNDNKDGKDEGLTDAKLTGQYLANFADGDPGEEVLFASNGWTNGGGFNTWWDASQVTYTDGEMHLAISENPADPKPANGEYLGGEARSTYYYGYGDYEVRMKPSPSPGTASTFFVCTGPYDTDKNGVENPWDEIDIEFLGNDTTRVQFNYFADSVGSHEHWVDLDFDASKEFHNYGFRWTEDYITWFVDGEPVHRVNKADVKDGEPFPTTAGRILTNYWCGNGQTVGWMGDYAGPDGKTVDYEWIKTSAQKQNPPKGDPYAPDEGDTYDGDWGEVAAEELNFASTDKYTVTPSADKKSADIVYTDVAGNSYLNVETDITAAAAEHGFMQLTVKNNGTAAVDLRINVQDADNHAINAAASQDGKKVNTDLVDGGSYFKIAAGKTAVCEVKYTGVAVSLQLMIDSATWTDSTTHAGDLTVSGLKFAGEGTKAPEVVTLDWSKIDAEELSFADSEPFTVVLSEDKLSADVTYTEAAGASYTNIEMAAPDIAEDANYAHFKIKNNGEESVYLRISLINNEKDEENIASGYSKSSDVNVSATMNGKPAETNLTNGGSYFTIPAGAEVECVIEFDGVIDRIQLMPDTAKFGDSTTHAGNLTVSELKFASSEESGEGGEGGGTSSDLPTADNKGVTINGAKLTVTGNTETYVVVSDGISNSMRVAYANLAGGKYQNLWMDATSISRDKNVFTVKVTNNGSAKLTFRIDIESATEKEHTTCCNVSATQDGNEVYTDTTWGGSKFEIEAGATAVCQVTYNTAEGPTNVKMFFDSCINEDTATHSCDVTLSEMAFSGTGSYTPPEPSEPQEPSTDPVALTFNKGENSGYTMTPGTDNKSWTLEYAGLGNTYAPVTAECAQLAARKNTFIIKIKNNKDTAVTVRVDVQGTTRVPNAQNADGTDCTNVSATCTGGTDLYTDMTWGGTKVTLAASEEVTLTITYDETRDQGAVKSILIFVDSMGGDTNEHDASVTVSDFYFEKRD